MVWSRDSRCTTYVAGHEIGGQGHDTKKAIHQELSEQYYVLVSLSESRFTAHHST